MNPQFNEPIISAREFLQDEASALQEEVEETKSITEQDYIEMSNDCKKRIEEKNNEIKVIKSENSALRIQVKTLMEYRKCKHQAEIYRIYLRDAYRREHTTNTMIINMADYIRISDEVKGDVCFTERHDHREEFNHHLDRDALTYSENDFEVHDEMAATIILNQIREHLE